MLRPNTTKVKFLKFKKGRIKGFETRGDHLSFGLYGIKTTNTFRMTPEQIETGRILLVKELRTIAKGLKFKIWIRVFPHIGLSSKPKEARMGKGKGKINKYVARVKAGQLLYEIDCPNLNNISLKNLITLLKPKFPINLLGISRNFEKI
jgi:large subunit ribosomal protein L16